MLRYRLRTLLIGIVLLALGLAWIGFQYRIVVKRRAIMGYDGHREGATFYSGVPGENCEKYIEGDALRRPSLFRLWLGDEQVDSILFDDIGEPKRAVIEAFPEADIYFWNL